MPFITVHVCTVCTYSILAAIGTLHISDCADIFTLVDVLTGFPVLRQGEPCGAHAEALSVRCVALVAAAAVVLGAQVHCCAVWSINLSARKILQRAEFS